MALDQSLLPLKRAHQEYGVAQSLLDQAVKRGEIKTITVGRTRLVERRDVEAWIRKHAAREGAAR